MSKILKSLAAGFMVASCVGCSNTSTSNSKLTVVPEEDRPRAIITTDVECDDMNSLIHLSLYFNEVDLDGVVYSASKYHFNGDGEHTLGQVTPNYLCEGEAVYTTKTGGAQPDPEATNLTSYRDIPTNWIENLWDVEYRDAYEHLSTNDANYPTPDYLLGITKKGNIAFEGDVREDTEGSDLIKNAILDDDQRKLYLYSWGGFNTIARALLSIAAEYQDTDQWAQIQEKVANKIVISGNGQDNSYTDNNIAGLFPGLQLMSTTNYYGVYFAPLLAGPFTLEDMRPMFGTPVDANYTFQSDWLKENIEFDHGSLMEKYNLMGDGTVFENEPDAYQYGLNPTVDWGYDAFPATTFDQYDFLAEGDSAGFMALLNNGLRGISEDGNYGTWIGRVSYNGEQLPTGYDYQIGMAGNANRFLLAYQQDWAARANWCVNDYADSNHAPVVNVAETEIVATPGQSVTLTGTVSDPDGDSVHSSWWVYDEGSIYNGTAGELRVYNPANLETGFTVPLDAQDGDYFNIVLEAQDDADSPMTRYNQVIVKVSTAN